MLHFRSTRTWFILAAMMLPILSASGQQDDADEKRQEQIVQRFQTVLEKNPRRGTAFDKIYGHHVERGTLDKFTQQLRDRVAKNPADGATWMIVGLVESQRGRDGLAVEAFTQAEKSLPKNAIASFYLGQSLVLAGRPDDAVAAFERAIERQPVQIDLLDIFQALGRVHQRAQRTDQALAVWNRLEKLFPNDQRVQEQIATTLAEEGQFAAALPRYEHLITLTKDEYRRAVLRQEIAELKIRLGKGTEAVADLESLLGKLNPDSWLYREVRRRIEDVFLRADDQNGLAKYYEQWLAKQSQDVDAMARLARVLARQARVPEAQQWLEKALKLAPTRRDLRLTFIDQLVDDKRFTDAIRQYEALDQSDPNNPDVLREWGKLILRDGTRPEADRRKAAETVWRKLLAARPKDALVATQVADLFRHANMPDQALELYRQAVELAPEQSQYREYLGEFYHMLKRRDEALATWRPIAEGKSRSAISVARLAEILAGFGYVSESLPEISAACQLDPKDLSLQIKAAELFAKAEKYSDADNHLTAAEKLVANPDEAELVLAQQLRLYQSDGSLKERIEKLSAAAAAADTPARQLFLLARFQEAMRHYPEATTAITRALALDGKSIPALATAARIQEQGGNLQAAADLNRQLANLDRRLRSTYLTNVARIESQLGNIDQAIQAGRDLIAAAPGNSENHSFFAQLCFRLGRQDEGLETLRRAVRANPSDPQLVTTLAQSLSEQFRTDEAIELYWQAFDRSTDLETKLNCVTKLTELYLQTSRFDKLLERLDRARREVTDSRREMTICLAQAYHSSGDFGQARQELESLLSDDTRDTQLLQQLSKLSEEEGELQAAVKFQEQVAKLAPAPEAEYRLANLLQRVGSSTESREILTRLALREEDPVKVLRNLDALLSAQDFQTVLTITESKLRESPKNWELLYREGVALANGKPDEASRRFQLIVEMNLAEDEPGVALAEQQKKAATQRTPANSPSTTKSRPLTGRAAMQSAQIQIRQAVGLDNRYYDPFGSSGISSRQAMWTPPVFGQARLCALAWLYKFADKAGQRDAFLKTRRELAESANASTAAQWDWMFFQQLTSSRPSSVTQGEVAQAMKRLAKSGDVDAQTMYLSTMQSRLQASLANVRNATAPPIEPLTAEDLDLAVDCYRKLVARLNANAPESSVIGLYAQALAAHLREANRANEAKQIVDEARQKTSGVQRASFALTEAVFEKEPSKLKESLGVWAIQMQQEAAKLSATTGSSRTAHMSISSSLPQVIGKLGPAKDHATVLQVFDTLLDWELAQRRQVSTNASQATRSISSANQRYRTSVAVWYGDQAEQVAVDYNPNADYYTQFAIRNVFHIFRRNEAVSELLQHAEQRISKAAPADLPYVYSLLSSLYAWNDDLPKSNELFAKAASAAAQDIGLRLEAASRLIQQQQLDEALTLLEGFTPQNQSALQQRESMVLDLAVRLGDIDRARTAAERLFGLRMSAEEQLNLAGHMRRLGQNEMADAVMARAQRQAGNRTTALVALMTQYQSDGKPDLAAQVAHQILRRTPAGTANTGTSTMYYSSSSGRNDGTRRAALQTLQQTGKLKELMARAEDQLKVSPGSTLLLETLAEYYNAAGERDKAAALETKLIEQTPDDPLKQFQLAEKLYQSQKFEEACEHYAVAIRREPRLLQRGYSQVTQCYQRANKTADLVKLLNEIDLKSIGQPYVISNLLGNMMSRGGNQTAAMGLFKKAWEAFPDQRAQLVSSIYRNEFWINPEMAQLLRQSLMPTAAILQQDPWHGMQANSYSSDGTINGMLAALFRGIKEEPDLRKLREEVAGAVKEFPAWQGGRLLLPVLDAKLGKVDEAKSAFEAVLKDSKTIPSQVARVAAQELEKQEALRDVCVQLYELALQDKSQSIDRQFQYSAGPRLVEMYAKIGRTDEARQLLLKASKSTNPDSFNSSDPDYMLYERIQSLQQIGDLFLKIDKPVDATHMYRSLTAMANSPEAKTSRFGSLEYQFQQVREGQKRALAQIKSRPFIELLNELLIVEKPESKSPTTLDLLLGTSTATNGSSKLDSLLLDLMRTKASSTDEKNQVINRVNEIVQRSPTHVSSRVLAAILSLSWSSPDAARAAADGLVKVVEEAPLEVIAPGQRPSVKQRQDAEQQIGLWLVARDYLPIESQRELGRKLADRALIAAERQLDNSYAMAILYEWGALALAAGDKPLASEKWGRMLDLIVTNSRVQRTRPTPTPGKPSPPVAPTPGNPAVPAVGAAPPDSKQPTLVPLTESQYAQFMSVAEMSAAGVPELSARAVRSALAGGPPVPDISPSMSLSSGGIIRVPSRSNAGLNLDGNKKVMTAFARVFPKWSNSPLPPQLMYETMRSIVFSPSRPKEILLYETAVGQDVPQNTLHMGRFLIPATIRASREKDLEAELLQRKTSPLAELPALVLLFDLHQATGQRDEAKRDLAAIHMLVAKKTSPSTVNLAAHAAVRSVSDPALFEAAVPIAQLATKTLGSASIQRSLQQMGGSLTHSLLLNDIRNGQRDAVKARIDADLQLRATAFADYGGDYAAQQQRQGLVDAANMTARGGMEALALNYLGSYLDAPRTSFGDSSALIALWHLERYFTAMPAKARYELLREWTLPHPNRRTVRPALAFAPAIDLPQSFLATIPTAKKLAASGGEAAATRLPTADTPLSNLIWLVEAARESNQLAELQTLASSAAQEKLPGALQLVALTMIAAGDLPAAEVKVREIMAAAKQREEEVAKQSQNRNLVDPADFLVFRACLAQPSLHELGEKFGTQLMSHAKSTSSSLITHIRFEQAKGDAEIQTAETPLARRDPGLKLWTSYDARKGTADMPLAWWAAHDGTVVHRTGHTQDALGLRYPLTGEFAFSFDVYLEHYASGEAAYAGIVCSPEPWSQRTMVSPWSRQESLTLPGPVEAFPGGVRRMTVQVAPGKTRFLVNGRLLYEDSAASPTSPWVELICIDHRSTAFWNPQLTGRPVIPREVRLVDTDRLDGWYSPTNTPLSKRTDAASIDPFAPAVPDGWVANAGELSRGNVDSSDLPPSLVSYHRPLHDGETIRYEFFIGENPQQLIHPAIGSLAFVITPDRLDLRWIPDPNDLFGFSLPGTKAPEMSLVKPESSNEALKSLQSKWNRMEVTLRGDTVSLRLNELKLCDYVLEPTNDRRFGFFHQHGTVAVRNIVLTGDWPEALEAADLSNLFARLDQPNSSAESRLPHALVGEPFYLKDVYGVWQRAMKLSDEERYAALLKWALPDDSHPTFRLQAAVSPVDSVSSTAANEAKKASISPLHRGGQLLAPVIELVHAAGKLNKLDDLSERILQASGDSNTARRSKIALQVLVAIARQDDAKAAELLQSLTTLTRETVAATPETDRHGDLIAVWESLERPALRVPAWQLSELLVEQQQSHNVSANWERLVRHVRGRARWNSNEITSKQPFGLVPQLQQWSPVSFATSETRGGGFPLAAWRVGPGEVEHFPGHSTDSLYFRLPLQGDFEVQYERSTYGWREVRVGYGTISVDPTYDAKSIWVRRTGRSDEKVDLADKIPNWSEWVTCRQVVKSGTMTTFVNGMEVHSAKVGGDPWLFIQSSTPQYQGTVRNLRILGSPTIPELLQLSSDGKLTGWRADYFREPIDDEDVARGWQKKGDEITSPRIEKAEHRFHENVLQYHRPLAEDGELTYEFFYVPDKTEVHVAVDREVLLVRPDGAKLHWLTDGAYERSGLTLQNETPIAGANQIEKPPLKPNSWNQMRVMLRGNTITLELNGTKVVDHQLSPNNERTFGLFHFQEQSEVRVRKVTYRGQWPTKLPEISEQELAAK